MDFKRLVTCIENDDVLAFALLLQSEPYINVSDTIKRTILMHVCSFQNRAQMLDLVMERSPNINMFDETNVDALRIAVTHNNVYAVRLLCEAGANLNLLYRVKSVGTASRILHEAVRAQMWVEDTDVINTLLSHGADPNCSDLTGRTPLHMCSDISEFACLPLFIAKGANIDVQDEKGETPLMVAVDYGNDEDVRTVLSFGAGINIQDAKGFTALHHACTFDDDESHIVRVLLENGADTSIMNEEGHTAYDLCTDDSQIGIRVVLDEHMQKKGS